MIPQVTLAEHVSRAWRPQLGVHEWSHPLMAFYDALVPLLPAAPWFVEVGVAVGRSLLFLAERLLKHKPGGLVVGVDPWQGQAHPDPAARSPTSWYHAFGEITRWGTPNELEICYLLRTESVRAAAGFDDARLAGVAIDGNHSYEAVKADIAAWRPKVAAGGVLCGDDYGDMFPGVRQAVDEAFPAGVELRGRVWAIRIPGPADLPPSGPAAGELHGPQLAGPRRRPRPHDRAGGQATSRPS